MYVSLSRLTFLCVRLERLTFLCVRLESLTYGRAWPAGSIVRWFLVVERTRVVEFPFEIFDLVDYSPHQTLA